MSRYSEDYLTEDDDSVLVRERGMQTPPPGRNSDADVESPPVLRHRNHSRKQKLYRPVRKPSLETVESLSTIQSHTEHAGHDNTSLSPDVKQVYQELQEINFKLQKEMRILHERELALKEREKAVHQAEENIAKLAEEEVRRRWQAKQQTYQREIDQIEKALHEKIKENRRLRDNFDTLKSGNDTLKKELENLQTHHIKLEKQSTSLQSRLTNLQRKQDYASRKEGSAVPSQVIFPKKTTKDTSKDSGKNIPKTSKPTSNTYDVISMLFDWLSDVHLRFMVTDQPTKPMESLRSPEFVQDKCFKILPSLVDILKELPSNNYNTVLPCLQFTYWALLHLDQAEPKSSLSSTIRRLGEELHKSKPARPTADPGSPNSFTPALPAEKHREGAFFYSTVLHIRFLSSLIILKTVTQVDHLAHVFEVLKNDLKQETARELFMHYQATAVFIPFLRPTSKIQACHATDIYLQMCMESVVMQLFLDSCSTEPWFRVCSLAFRQPGQNDKVIEKLSIILQKLSKIKSNRRYFEVFGITTSCQEMMRAHSSDTFLLLNIKSILFNLGVLRPPTSTLESV